MIPLHPSEHFLPERWTYSVEVTIQSVAESCIIAILHKTSFWKNHKLWSHFHQAFNRWVAGNYALSAVKITKIRQQTELHYFNSQSIFISCRLMWDLVLSRLNRAPIGHVSYASPFRTRWAPHCLRAACAANQNSLGTLLTIQIGGINLPGTRHFTSIWDYICRSLVLFLSPRAHWAVHRKSHCLPITLLEKQLQTYAERQDRKRGGRRSGGSIWSNPKSHSLRWGHENAFQHMLWTSAWNTQWDSAVQIHTGTVRAVLRGDWPVWSCGGEPGVSIIPCLGKVCPVGHDHSAEHDVVLGEIAGKQLSRSDHRQAKHIWDLISVRCVRPRRYLTSTRQMESH